MQKLFNIKKSTEKYTGKTKRPQSPRISNSIFGLTVLMLITFLFLTSCKEEDSGDISKESEQSSREQVKKSSKPQREMIDNSNPNAKDDHAHSLVTVVTNKKLYLQGESIKIEVKNNLAVPIWYINFAQPDLVFWSLEKFQNNKWEALYFRLPVMENDKEICQLNMYERPIGVAKELTPNSLIDYEWNQKLCRFEGANATKQFDPEILAPGKYRFTFCYSLKTVKTENKDAEPWKRPIDLGETKLVYSNEFAVK